MNDTQFATYHVGDKVRVLDYMPKFKHTIEFTQEMLKEFGGKVVTISYVGHYDRYGHTYITNMLQPCDNFIYHIKEDYDKYYWTNTMFSVV